LAPASVLMKLVLPSPVKPIRRKATGSTEASGVVAIPVNLPESVSGRSCIANVVCEERDGVDWITRFIQFQEGAGVAV